MTSTTVFVSGATGFIAQHLIKQLIEKGYYVVGSVRSSEKGENLRKLLNSDKFSYEIVEAIEEEGAFDNALKKHPEITVFLHTASPFHFNVKDIEKELLTPAVSGTKNALISIKKYAPQVKKVVVTSSFAAMYPKDDNDATILVNEDSWSSFTWEESLSSPFLGYMGSKKFAEKAVWEFVESQEPNFDVSIINPVYVFGPQAFDENAKGDLNTSAEILKTVLTLKQNDQVPDSKGAFIDVRDVAAAHIVAFEKAEAVNQRLFLTEGRFTAQDILDILHDKLPEYAAKLPKGSPGSGKSQPFAVLDNKKTKGILGFKFNSLENIVVDTVKQHLASNK